MITSLSKTSPRVAAWAVAGVLAASAGASAQPSPAPAASSSSPASSPTPLPALPYTVLAAPAAAEEHVWLRTRGTQIVTAPSSEGGERPFVAAGIGYARNVIIHEQDREVMAFCQAHGLNTVRLCFYTKNFNNKADKPIDLDEHMARFIDPVVAAARERGLYVILDDHEYLSEEIDEATARAKQKGNTWDEAALQAWTNAWVKVAQRYRHDPYVLGYELMNEPHDIPYAEVRTKLTRCIKAIREVDTRHIILASSADWTHSRAMEKTWGAEAATVDSPHHNVVFTFHDYPQDDYPPKVLRQVTAFRDAHGVPVMCTEFGATQWNKSETVCREHEAGLLAVCAREHIGWMVWALKTLVDNPRNPYNEFDKVGMGPPRSNDSCQYSDLWAPVAHVTATSFPQPRKP